MSNTNYKVSIVTVSYNSAKTIEQTIQSVLGQSYKNIEYIIIDGLSTDGTHKIIEKYENCITYFISEKDDGLYYAMNKGIQRSTGDIIGIINSDDWYARDSVQKVVDYFSKNDVDLLYGKIVSVFEDGKEELNQTIPLDNIWYRMALPHPSVFIRKSIYEKYGTFDIKYKIASDYELLLRFYSKQIKFGYLDDVIAYFRVGGISAEKQDEMIEETHEISLSYIEDCPNKGIVLDKIEEKYKWNCFMRKIITDEGGMLYELICDYFLNRINNIVIFGAGILGKECYKILKASNMYIRCFVDNDKKKWNTDFAGVKVISPNELSNMDGCMYILIAVKEKGNEIKCQLKDIDNEKLHCVSIKELRDVFYKKKLQKV